jgi:hypothetical protein
MRSPESNITSEGFSYGTESTEPGRKSTMNCPCGRCKINITVSRCRPSISLPIPIGKI